MVDYMISALKKPRAGTAISVLCLFLLILLFRDSEAAGEHMKRGMKICFETLVPSLFPFMVISELLVRSGACEPISRIMKRPMAAFFGVSGECASALFLGIICGFPVGAKAAASLYSQGNITRGECEHLLTFCNFPSAPFMIFAVGEGMFGNRKIGIFLYCTVLISGLLCGILMRSKERKNHIINASNRILTEDNIFSIFVSSVVSAAGSVISVCSFVTFFTCIVGTCSSVFGTAADSPLSALLFSFFELTSGSAACSSFGDPRLGVILAASAGGWSGLSVFLQIYSLTRTKGEELSLVPYIKSKALCALICSLTAALFTYLFPSLTEGINTAEDAFSAVVSYPKNFTAGVNIIFIFASLICLYKLLDRKRKI
jgi:sporulation integral membrane protein YlbJ